MWRERAILLVRSSGVARRPRKKGSTPCLALLLEYLCLWGWGRSQEARSLGIRSERNQETCLAQRMGAASLPHLVTLLDSQRHSRPGRIQSSVAAFVAVATLGYPRFSHHPFRLVFSLGLHLRASAPLVR